MSDGGYLLGGPSRSIISGNKTLGNFGNGDCWIVKLASEIVPLPMLSIAPAGEDVVVSWPSPSTGFVLEETMDAASGSWTTNSSTPVDDGTNKSVSIIPTAIETYFRLRKPD